MCAALALMYGYAASYAPSTAIEARIETLVVSLYLVSKNGKIRNIKVFCHLCKRSLDNLLTLSLRLSFFFFEFYFMNLWD